MADIKNIRAGNTSPTDIMFDKYIIPKANQNIYFKEIIPKSNIYANIQASAYQSGVWQINDGWDIEIVNDKTIAIKKFKIDTWGLRKVMPSDLSRYKSLKVEVKGITRVHNEVIRHTSGSDVVDGFTQAYGGTGGYNVYWFPGQFTSGNYMRGLIIQGGSGYQANANEIDDGLLIGKHPWDMQGRTCITDGVTTGTWFDGSYRTINIGLFGGVQNAKSWHDETGEAYRQYDISDAPIYINLDVDDTSKEVDLTTKECWDAYLGTTLIYHKGKTFENCWRKYGFVYPNNFNLFKHTFVNNSLIVWQNPTTFKVNAVNETITVSKGSSSVNANYTTFSDVGFDIKIKNKPVNVTVEFRRIIENSTKENDSVYIVLDEGTNTIEPYSKLVYRNDSSANIVFKPVELIISGNISECNMLIEFAPIYTNINIFKMSSYVWSTFFSKLVFPVIDDFEDYIGKTKFNITPANVSFWDRVKEWYKNNIGLNDNFRSNNVFNSAGNLDEITIKLPNDSYGFGEDNFAASAIKTINFVQTGKLSHFSSPQRLLRSAWNLRTINIQWYNDEPDWLCGANTIADGMSCGLETYPERFINWGKQRSNTFNNTIPCTLFQYAFNSASNLVEIPSYPGTEDENTIVPANYVVNAFNGCSKLVKVGPILNLTVVKPDSAANIFNNCSALSHIRIKNLNHGNWNFDNVSRNGIKHGTLAALDTECVKYLFDNLSDLTTSDPARHVETIDNSFKNWTSDYFNGSYYTPDYDYTLSHVTRFNCRKRYATADEAVYIVSTTRKLTEMQIRITGMQSGDKVIFGATGSVPLYEITANGVYSITKDTTTTMGFKLVNENTDLRSDVVIGIENGLDYTNPVVMLAAIYCPAEWEDKITDDMVSNANNKGWFIYINNVLKEI